MNTLQSIFGNEQTADLKTIIEQGAFLVDVRTAAEFMEGHVKGSVNIPLDTIPAQIASFKDKKNIIVFCRSGSRSSMSKTFLEQSGIKQVINGGAWDYVNRFVK